MQLAGKYKLVRINKGADIALLIDIREIKSPCNENKTLIKNFLHSQQPTEPSEETGVCSSSLSS